ncbi:MAG: hypothetical protein M3220_17000 [Chloroflexota bacterium]|nr:hypothetical protein [Chloroflexota bacterium]
MVEFIGSAEALREGCQCPLAFRAPAYEETLVSIQAGLDHEESNVAPLGPSLTFSNSLLVGTTVSGS